ncbi:hypothetical protein [uncultured Tissierella sp.]|jgi:hypothetical protein|uniref:hypothetical protein n=1 Tax=uncultured Tissierella sp. TaxID=448160 RepID=UPI0028051896|nr:hypothetical protein [uncultured Tissierella sp.]MDU5082547.1 hypothetical protein [Bacillota bacterium]
MKRRKLISVVVLMFLLFNLSMGVFAGADSGTARPEAKRYSGYQGKPEYPTVSSCGGDAGTTRPN